MAARRYMTDSFRREADLALEEFFDRVNQDRLMAFVAQRMKDKRLLKLEIHEANSAVAHSRAEAEKAEQVTGSCSRCSWLSSHGARSAG